MTPPARFIIQLVEEESTNKVLEALCDAVEKQGLFCALYSSAVSHFFETPEAGGKVDLARLTQAGVRCGS
jgi:hypothetical protein